ncbi:MAG: aldo/keto reductase [Anaerolineales bacterium]|nr:aldo/keto reductase [Anaerolineales bacterium]
MQNIIGKQPFVFAEDSVDPAAVPYRTVYTGAKLPAVGIGTFGSDRYSAENIAQAVKGAISVGYRHIDCAAVYGNERMIGQTFCEVFDSGLVKREELWVTSKLWNDKHAEEDVIPACKQSLNDLQLDFLDLYLIHWPFPNHHDPGVDVNARDPHAVPYIHANFMKTWRQMEKLVDLGLVKHIGTSNMSQAKLQLLLRDARIQPAVNEMELHPHFQQPELFQFCIDNQIVPIGFSPIGSPTRPDRDTTPDDTVDIEDPVIVKAAERLNVHPAVVCVKWAVQRGQVPIPFSIHREQYLGNLRAAVIDPLTVEEMAAIAGIDKNCRLIKGQVFLWEGAESWEDLWD